MSVYVCGRIYSAVGLLLVPWLEMTSPEAAAISLNSELLCQGVPNVAGVTWFANKLVETAFITSNASDNVVLTPGLSDTDKCYRLLSAVKTQVAANPALFHTLLAILRSQAALETYADAITKSYGRKKTCWVGVWGGECHP